MNSVQGSSRSQAPDFERKGLEALSKELQKGKEAELSTYVQDILDLCQHVLDGEASNDEQGCLELLRKYVVTDGKELPEAVATNKVAKELICRIHITDLPTDVVSSKILSRLPTSLHTVFSLVSKGFQALKKDHQDVEEGLRCDELIASKAIFIKSFKELRSKSPKEEVKKINEALKILQEENFTVDLSDKTRYYEPKKSELLEHQILTALAKVSEETLEFPLCELRNPERKNRDKPVYYHNWRVNVAIYRDPDENKVDNISNKGLFIKAVQTVNTERHDHLSSLAITITGNRKCSLSPPSNLALDKHLHEMNLHLKAKSLIDKGDFKEAIALFNQMTNRSERNFLVEDLVLKMTDLEHSEEAIELTNLYVVDERFRKRILNQIKQKTENSINERMETLLVEKRFDKALEKANSLQQTDQNFYIRSMSKIAIAMAKDERFEEAQRLASELADNNGKVSKRTVVGIAVEMVKHYKDNEATQWLKGLSLLGDSYVKDKLRECRDERDAQS